MPETLRFLRQILIIDKCYNPASLGTRLINDQFAEMFKILLIEPTCSPVITSDISPVISLMSFAMSYYEVTSQNIFIRYSQSQNVYTFFMT